MLRHSGGRYFLVAITCLLASQRGGACVVDLTPHGCGRNVGALQARPARVAFIIRAPTLDRTHNGTWHTRRHARLPCRPLCRWPHHARHCATLQRVATRYSVLQRVAACCAAFAAGRSAHGAARGHGHGVWTRGQPAAAVALHGRYVALRSCPLVLLSTPITPGVLLEPPEPPTPRALPFWVGAHPLPWRSWATA